ncbi:MAG TPA: DUF309 domain-containing protein [Blastocatellia bacterium]|jgi:hypothetical protein|nr:DUF309 domain-containing protein [Blastocatellia bacterium]
MAFFKFESGPRAGERVALDKSKITFGRQSTCDCVLKHPTVSRVHFFIERAGNKFLVVDNSSGNGTFANGERITWAELKHGDNIQAGPFAFTVELHLDAPDVSSIIDIPASEPGGVSSELQGEARGFYAEHEMAYPREYLLGIEHFNARRYFEAHEEWEEVWLRSSGETKTFYQMLIQAAVGLHHFENGNARGVRGMYRGVIEKLPKLPAIFMSLDLADFGRQYRELFGSFCESDAGGPLPVAEHRPSIMLLDDRAEGA